MYHRKVIIRPDGDAYHIYCFPSVSFPALSFFSLSFLYSPLPIPQLLSAVYLLPGLPSLPSTAAPPLPRRLTPTSPLPYCLSAPLSHGRDLGWDRWRRATTAGDGDGDAATSGARAVRGGAGGRNGGGGGGEWPMCYDRASGWQHKWSAQRGMARAAAVA